MKLFVFGLGYTAGHFVRHHLPVGVDVDATVRSRDKAEAWAESGVTVHLFDGTLADLEIAAALAQSDALLVSVQPGQGPDPVLKAFAAEIKAAPRLRSIVYLSTIGVYGDHGGAWIDETAATEASNARQSVRIDVERDWLALGREIGASVVILRLAGIYGPGRNALRDLHENEARRIDKPGQVFNRIHVGDIGRAISQALSYRGSDTVFNVTDDEPAPAPDVVAYAARLMEISPPPLMSFAEANLSPMARSFYGANRRVSNKRLKEELGVRLAFPTFREGLDALWAAGEGRS